MSDKKIGPVEASIARLRELRYMTRGPGANLNRSAAAAPTLKKLRASIDDASKRAAAKPAKKAKKKKRSARR